MGKAEPSFEIEPIGAAAEITADLDLPFEIPRSVMENLRVGDLLLFEDLPSSCFIIKNKLVELGANGTIVTYYYDLLSRMDPRQSEMKLVRRQ